MNFNIFLWILVIFVIVIIIVYFIFMFRVTKAVINNYDYLKKQYQDLYKTVSDLKNKFDSLDIDVPELDNFIEQIKTNIKNIEDLQNTINDINVNLKNTDKRISNLEQDNKNINTNINSINKTIESQEDEIKKLNESINTINKDLKTLFDNKDSVDQNLTQLNQQYNIYINDKAKLEESINSRFEEINKEIESLKKQYSQDGLQKQIDDLKTITTSNTNQLKTLDKNVTDINTKLLNIESSIDTINKNIKTSQDNIETIQNNINSINSKIKILEDKTNEELASLKNSLEEIINTIETINTNFNNIKKDITNIQNNISSINKQIEELQDHDITKNYIDFINIVSVYEYNKLSSSIYSNPVDSFNDILNTINISLKKNLNILCINDINFDVKVFNSTGTNLVIFNKSSKEKIFVFSKSRNTDKILCDMFYINSDYTYSDSYEEDYGEENKKAYILNLRYKINEVFDGNNKMYFYQNYFFIISSEKQLDLKNNMALYTTLKRELNTTLPDEIFKSNLIFLFTDSDLSNKETIVDYINEGFNKKFDNNTLMFSEKISNKFLYIGDYKVFNDVFLNGIKYSLTSALILNNNNVYKGSTNISPIPISH